jgi:hypothetical protein
MKAPPSEGGGRKKVLLLGLQIFEFIDMNAVGALIPVSLRKNLIIFPLSMTGPLYLSPPPLMGGGRGVGDLMALTHYALH